MKILRAAPLDPVDPNQNRFTGSAHVKRPTEDEAGVPAAVYRVAFSDGTLTNWHTHSGPQQLLIIQGRVSVQQWGQPGEDVGQGDAVVFAPDEKHWHGETPGSTGIHLAMNVNVETEWLESVGDKLYDGS